MVSNCSKVPVLGTHWQTRDSTYGLWSNSHVLSVTKWTRACDKRLSRLISYIHHTSEFKQYCRVGNTAQQRRLGLFQDTDFCRRPRRFGSDTFVPTSWMCKKQTSVSHSSTESEIISLDAGLRKVLHSSSYQPKKNPTAGKLAA